MTAPAFISIPDLATRWGFDRTGANSLRREVTAGRIPSMRVGNTVRIPLAYVEAHEAEALKGLAS